MEAHPPLPSGHWFYGDVLEIRNIGGVFYNLEQGSLTHFQSDTTVRVDTTGPEITSLNRITGFVAYPDEELLVYDVHAKAALELEGLVTGSSSTAVGGLFGEYGLDEGSFVVDSSFEVDLKLRAPNTANDVHFRQVGAFSGYGLEEGGILRTSIVGTIEIDTRDATGNVTIEHVGGAFGRSPLYESTLQDVLVDVDITIYGDAQGVGAFAGYSQKQIVQDTLVKGSVTIHGDGTYIGGLIGEPNSSSQEQIFSSVIWLGSVNVSGNVTESGVLWGRQNSPGIIGNNVWWNSDTTGVAVSDHPTLIGAPATSAQLGDIDWLESQGFSLAAWCVHNSEPAIRALTPTCQAFTGYNSLIETSTLPVGSAECPEGGTLVKVGLDDGSGADCTSTDPCIANNGILESGEVDDSFAVCHGTSGQDGQDGQNGEDGLLSLVSVQEEIEVGSVICPNGGLEVSTGLDLNHDGTLDSNEVTDTFVICHGEHGVAGQDGQPGADGQDGVPGQDGQDGQPGADGQDGAKSLVRTTDIEPGDACTTGGILVEVGLDLNRNGALDPDEVTDVATLCHGQSEVCTVSESEEGAIISCPDGTTTTLRIPGAGEIDAAATGGCNTTSSAATTSLWALPLLLLLAVRRRRSIEMAI